jgi:hypothetical protein
LSESRKLIANPTNYELTEIDFRFLGACLQSHTANPIGLAFYRISNNLRNVNEALLQIASIKLERMGLLSKTIETDEQDGYDYYAYSITEIGIDVLLKNEHIFHPKAKVMSASFDDMDF